MCRDKGEITVKGFCPFVPIYQVIDFRQDLGNSRSFIEHEGDGFAMYLDSEKVDANERGAHHPGAGQCGPPPPRRITTGDRAGWLARYPCRLSARD